MCTRSVNWSCLMVFGFYGFMIIVSRDLTMLITFLVRLQSLFLIGKANQMMRKSSKSLIKNENGSSSFRIGMLRFSRL
jgi:hypothetical protein